jgi:hypothetical protein
MNVILSNFRVQTEFTEVLCEHKIVSKYPDLYVFNKKFFSHCRHEVCIGGATGLVAMSFGQENVDRYIVVYKKEFSPTENEVYSLEKHIFQFIYSFFVILGACQKE